MYRLSEQSFVNSSRSVAGTCHESDHSPYWLAPSSFGRSDNLSSFRRNYYIFYGSIAATANSIGITSC